MIPEIIGSIVNTLLQNLPMIINVAIQIIIALITRTSSGVTTTNNDVATNNNTDRYSFNSEFPTDSTSST